MEKRTLSDSAKKILDSYLNFRIGDAMTSVPYFNNRTVGKRFGERTKVGKGSPSDIKDELDIYLVKNHIAQGSLDSATLAKILTDNNLGVDCSAFAYYILDAETKHLGQGHLNRRMTFLKGNNPVAKMFSYLRPVQNCDVKTFASDRNSRVIEISAAQPGDIITMVGGPDGNDRNHILLIHEVEYENGAAKSLYYSHAIAYPEDGRYGTGVKQGKIEITDPHENISKQTWSESGNIANAKRIQERSASSTTELRRLKWVS